MTTLKYNDYEGSAEIDMDRGVCKGKVLFIDDLITYEAETPAALYEEFKAAVDDYLETCAQVGITPKTSLKGQFNVRISPAEHRAAAVCARDNKQSLNEFVRECIVKGCSSKHPAATAGHWSVLSAEVERLIFDSSVSTKKAVSSKHHVGSLATYKLAMPAVMEIASEVSDDVYEKEDEESLWSLPPELSVLNHQSKLPN